MRSKLAPTLLTTGLISLFGKKDCEWWTALITEFVRGLVSTCEYSSAWYVAVCFKAERGSFVPWLGR